MFPEFGQAPLCIELDLDSYDGSWTHMAAFRGGGGWIMAARATIQSEHDLMRATLIAACDEYENPIPAWRAEHLLTCDWSNLEHCRELPPELLDDLLCEEEGAFFARWQRQTNGELVTLHNRAEHELAAIDARATIVQRQADSEIADLQRRRRHPDATPEARAALAHLIAQIEADSDAVVADATARRAALRREIDAAEEALWDRGDVLIEVEPMWCVQWQAMSARNVQRRPVRKGGVGFGYGDARTPAEWRYAQYVRQQEQIDALSAQLWLAKGKLELARKSLATVKVRPTGLMSVAQREARRVNIERETAAVALFQQRCDDLRAQLAAARDGVADGLAVAVVTVRADAAETDRDVPSIPVSPLPDVEEPPQPPPVPLIVTEPPPPILPSGPPLPAPVADIQPDPWAKARIERAALLKQLAAVEQVGQKFLSGSPKFKHNRDEQAALRTRVRALDAIIGDTAAMPAPVVATPPTSPSLDQLEADRALLAAELTAHERRGAAVADGKRRFILYAARRAELQARLRRLDAQLANARARARATA